MNSLILLAALSCPKVQLGNTSGLPITDMDNKNIAQATKRCGQKYPKSPCLIKFIKTGFQAYTAICGAKR